jgi:hypothetical protein
MPLDLAVMMPIDRAALSESLRRSVGATDYIIEPFQNDLQFDSAKHLRMASGTPKLVQSILRVMMTSKGEYIEDAQWGAGIAAMVGGKLNSGEQVIKINHADFLAAAADHRQKTFVDVLK